MNILLGFLSIIITFSLVVIIERLFKKEGLFVWISVITVIANILVCKSIEILGFVTCLGNVSFASNFLASNILCEKYSKEDSIKAIRLGVFSSIIFIILTQFALLFIPSNEDLVQNSMKTLFSINLRTSIASISMYYISNILSINIYEKIKKRIPKKKWIRNNVSTMVCNSLENYLFTTLAFIGIFDILTIISIATVASVIEIVIAALDTPFLYLSTKK
ncbi:MAG: queuosine precursor transporter [Bacilli bacterium]|nr:queuosine precursor transporter [Bacilli bacterium]